MNNNNFVISYSSLRLFEESPSTFYRKYVQKRKINRKLSEDIICGEIIHDILSYCENYAKKYKVNKLDKERIDYFLNEFDERFNKYPKVSYKIKRRYRKYLRTYLTKRAGREKVLATERRFKVRTTNGVDITGVIDKIIEPKSGYIEIVDYKSSEDMLSKDELRNDLQLSFYDIAAKKLFKNKTVLVSVHYLAHDKKVVVRRYKKDRIKFNKYVKKMNKKINKLFVNRGDK